MPKQLPPSVVQNASPVKLGKVASMPARTSVGGNSARLEVLQRSMAQTLMRPLTASENMQSESTAIAQELIKPNDRLSSFERLQIYNQQYWWRLLGNFGEDFHGLRAVLGPRKFDRLAVAYLAECGSTSWSLRDLGEKLSSFIAAHPESVAPHERLATDMVLVEWARVVAFDGPERPVIDSGKLASTPPDRLKLGIQPYVSLLELWHPIDELLSSLRETSIETGTLSNAVAATRTPRRKRLSAAPRKKPLHLAVHRHDFSVYYKRLDPEAFRLLSALRGGATLETACALAFEGAKELPEQSAAKIQNWFSNWMQLGWFCS